MDQDRGCLHHGTSALLRVQKNLTWQKRNQGSHYNNLVAVVKLKTGVEVGAGLCLISRAPSAGVQPEPTWSYISNRVDLLYLRAEPFFGSDPDQSARYACEESLNYGDLAAQDKTTCTLAPLPSISGVHLGPISQ